MAILGRLALKNKNNSTTYANNNKEVLAVKQNEFFNDDIDSEYNKIDDDLINLTYDNNTGDTLEDIINGLKNDFLPLLEGTVNIGDVLGPPTGALTVTGDITSASKDNSSGQSRITVNFVDLGTTDYFIQFMYKNTNTQSLILSPVVFSINSNSFSVEIDEEGSVNQNLILYVRIVKFNGLV